MTSQRVIPAVVLICLAATVPYISTVNGYFIRDDFGVVQLLAGKPADYFPRWFYTSWMDHIWGFNADEVRPFPALSYQLTALPGAGVAWGHHLFNMALHAANGVLVLIMARRVAHLSLWAATFAAMAFVLLPVNPETVTWITGRVDSMPAFFYVGAFLLYAGWRERERSPGLYAASLAVFFLALFTKQTTITMIGTLVAYDLLVAPAPFRPLWKRALAYAPFALLTAGYLALRYALFGQFAREERLTREGLRLFVQLVDRHLASVIIGDVDGSRVLVALLLATTAGLCFLSPAFRTGVVVRRTVFFGPVWWIVAVAPVLVAGYESPRHVYLAAMGWAVLLGMAVESAASLRRSVHWQRGVLALAGGVLVVYGTLLASEVAKWSRIGAVSQRAVRDIRAESLAASPGALIIAGAPPRSWEWALPFAVQPPFTRTDLTQRSYIISPWALHCCRQQWFADTRRTLAAWSGGPAPHVVIALRWDPESGRLSRMSSANDEALTVIAHALSEVPRPEALDLAIRRLVEFIGPAGAASD